MPEIALTPAMAGQFFQRFGDRVAILHSAFTDTERAEQWRRIRSGAGAGGGGDAIRRVRSGAQPGPDRGGRGTRPQLQAGRDAALQRARRGDRARASRGRLRRAGLGHAQPGEPLQRRARQVHAAGAARAHRAAAACRRSTLVDMRTEFLETRKQATFSRRAAGRDPRAPGATASRPCCC